MSAERKAKPDAIISARESASIMSSTIIGVGVLTLPRGAAEFAKQSGWFAVVIGTLIAMCAVAVMTALVKRFPHRGIVEYSADILGIGNRRLIGRLLSAPFLLIFIAYWGFSTVIVARMFGEVVITTVLTETPLEVIISTMLVTAFVMTLYEIDVLAKVNEMLLPIIVVPVLIIAISSFQSARMYNLFPLHYKLDLFAFLEGIMVSAFSFLGFEIMLMYSKYTQKSADLLRANLAGVAIPGAVYTLIVLSGIAVFGTEELELLAWPTLELVKVTEVPGLILERLESAFLGVWVAAVFTTTANLYYGASMILKELLGLKGHRLIALIALPVFYWLSLLPQNVHMLFRYQRFSGYLGGVATLTIPLLLFVIAVVRKKGGERG